MTAIKNNSSISEISEIGTGVTELSKSYPISEDAYFELTFGKISDKSNELIERINGGWLSSELKEKDEIRDLDVRAIFYEVEAKCIRRSSANQEKALKVMDVLNRYGMKIIGSCHTNESAQIRALLSDLEAPEMEENVSSVPDLKQLMANLTQSQAGFDTSSAKLIEDKNAREHTKPASIVAKELKELFNDEFEPYLNAMCMANPAKYKAFSELVNVLVSDSNKKVRDRLAALKRKREAANTELN
ncbi:DUF6261 family protein [Ancylomarina sp.]|uniref:DUF6261 family protein n=1 Tax=Ancylomarina sp. TaxID=1970196 RepID=UPI003568B1CE